MTQRDMAGILKVTPMTLRNWKKEKPRLYEIIQKGFAFDHRILIIAEARQNTGDKIIEFHKSLCAGHGKMERFKRAEMI